MRSARSFGIFLSSAITPLLVAALALPAPVRAQQAPAGMTPGNGASMDPANQDGQAGFAPISPLSRPEAHDHDQDQNPDDADSKSKQQAPPPSLPGSHAEPVPVAPPDKETSDMNPTDALFDAINRGDSAAARDALNRGADVNGKNILGQTPLAMSVDLGRNEISFMLLSVRSSTQEDAAAAPPAPDSGSGAGSGAGEGSQASLSAASSVSAPPVPDAGFLGFGGKPGGS